MGRDAFIPTEDVLVVVKPAYVIWKVIFDNKSAI